MTEKIPKREFSLDMYRKKLLGILDSYRPGSMASRYVKDSKYLKEEIRLTTMNIGIIDAMTDSERTNPSLVMEKSRYKRIAIKADVSFGDIFTLVDQYFEFRARQ